MSVVQFYLWFEFFFSFVSNSLFFHYHTLRYPKTKENKIETNDQTEPQHMYEKLSEGLWGWEETTFLSSFFVVFFCPQTHPPPPPPPPQNTPGSLTAG